MQDSPVFHTKHFIPNSGAKLRLWRRILVCAVFALAIQAILGAVLHVSAEVFAWIWVTIFIAVVAGLKLIKYASTVQKICFADHELHIHKADAVTTIPLNSVAQVFITCDTTMKDFYPTIVLKDHKGEDEARINAGEIPDRKAFCVELSSQILLAGGSIGSATERRTEQLRKRNRNRRAVFGIHLFLLLALGTLSGLAGHEAFFFTPPETAEYSIGEYEARGRPIAKFMFYCVFPFFLFFCTLFVLALKDYLFELSPRPMLLRPGETIEDRLGLSHLPGDTQ